MLAAVDMTPVRFLLALLLVAAAPAPVPDAVTLDRAAPVVDATVAGVPARLAVTLDTGVYLAPALAARVPLAWGPGRYEEVGRVRVRFRQATGAVAIAGVDRTVRLQTRDAPCCAGQDGEIGVMDLPWSVVRIGQGPAGAETRYPAEVDAQSGLSLPWKVRGTVIHVILAPDQAETVATAAAAAVLAKAYGGQFAGPGRELALAYGVPRAVRDIAFARPPVLLGASLDRIAVRLGDFGGGAALPEEPAGEGIVVRRKVRAQQGWPAITVGRDRLARCPVITVHRDAGTIGLACDPSLLAPEPLHARR
jgi:hypothetical protein